MSDHVASPAIALQPRAISEHHDFRFARLILTDKKNAAEKRLDAQGAEKAIAHTSRRNRYHARRGAEQITHTGVGLKRAKGVIQSLPIFVVGARKVRPGKNCLLLSHIGQAARVRIRKRLDQSCIDKSEDRHAHAHAKRQNEDRRQREAWVLAHLPQGKTQILDDRFHPKTYHLMALLSEHGLIPELPHS